MVDRLPHRLLFWVQLSALSLWHGKATLEVLEPFARKKIAANPKATSPRMLLAELYKDAKQYAKAIAELQHIRNLGCQRPGLIRELGELYYKEKNYAAARDCLAAVIDHFAADGKVQARLGMAYAYTAAYAESLAPLQQALALSLKDPELHETLGFAFFKLGRFAEAAAAYELALRAKPHAQETRNNAARARVYRANELLAGNDRGDAIRELRAALRLAPDAEIAREIGGTLSTLGETAGDTLQ